MKKWLITGLLICIVTTGVIMALPVEAENDKEEKSQIAYVNMQELFLNHPAKKNSEVKLNEEAKKLQKKLETEAKDMTKEERQKLLEKYQQQLTQKERELVQGIMEDIDQQIKKVAQQEGVTLVVDESAVSYGGYDLTDDVLQAIKNNQDKEDNQSKETE